MVTEMTPSMFTVMRSESTGLLISIFSYTVYWSFSLSLPVVAVRHNTSASLFFLSQLRKMSNEPIAIIGTACRFAGGVTSPASLWDLLESPRDVQTSIPESRFNTDGYYHKDGTFHGHTAVQHMYSLDQHPGAFDAQFFQIKPVEARAIDPQQRILLELVYEATEAAGLSIEKLKGTKTGVYVGQMCNDHEMLVNTDITTSTYSK